jgi:hypothetical protein
MKQLLLFPFMMLCIHLTAQETIIPTGGNTSGSGASASYSVGQVVYINNKGTNGTVIQGVQQPYEISVITVTEEAKGINLSVTAYPNPTIDYLQLTVESEQLKELSYQLFDMQGKLLKGEKITGKQTSIIISNLVPATYFVKVTQSNKELKTFKIIKQ